MTQAELNSLQIGDIIQNIPSGSGYVVINNDDTIVAARTITVTNPTEWTKVRTSTNVKPQTPTT